MGDVTTQTILNNINQSLSNINNTLGTVFPQGEVITSSAGASAGKYLTILGPDGIQYKIALLLP